MAAGMTGFNRVTFNNHYLPENMNSFPFSNVIEPQIIGEVAFIKPVF
jgi:hypothetical protein